MKARKSLGLNPVKRRDRPFTPKRELGQNFLTNPDVVADILLASKIKAGETVLEIGPGTGVLTEALLDAGAHVIAIEKDDRLIELLNKKFAGKRFDLIHGDILSLNISSLFANFKLHISSFKIVANIPYYITGKFLRNIFESEKLPERIVLLLQKEVAERIVAKDGKESILSISVKAYGTPSIVRYVSRNDFDPVPNVDSAVLLIGSISRDFFSAVGPLRIDEGKFFELVRKGFAHKRKKLGSNLGLDLGNKRAEELSLVEWGKLYRSYYS